MKKCFLNGSRIKLWDIQKNIEEDEKLALRKEEHVKETKESSLE